MKQRFWHFLRRGIVVVVATAATNILPVWAELNVSPETITLAGTRADQLSTTLTFSDSDGIPVLQAAVSDLRRTDGGKLISASSIRIDPPKLEVLADAPAQITISLDLADTSASGEFTGSLYLYRQSGRQVVPLTVRVKAAPWWPWLVMLFGVGLGTWLSFYRTEGQARDEVVVQVGRLRSQMRSDPELDLDYRAGINAALVDVESALEDKNWEVAKTEVQEAKQVWTRWRKGREDWVAQIKNGKALIAEYFDKLPATTLSTVYMQGVKDQIDAVYRKLRTGQYETPQSLKDDFSEIRQSLSDYKEGEAMLGHLKEMRADSGLSGKKEQYWIKELSLLEQQLGNRPPDSENYEKWKEGVDSAKTNMQSDIAEASTAKSTGTGTRGLAGRSADEQLIRGQILPPSPSISSVFQPERVSQAKRNLKAFNWVSRIVAILFLAWLGITELYGSNPTFGAEPLKDYLALLAWGFGAELTRESVVSATQNLGLPLTK
jgi:hypothetical protein